MIDIYNGKFEIWKIATCAIAGFPRQTGDRESTYKSLDMYIYLKAAPGATYTSLHQGIGK